MISILELIVPKGNRRPTLSLSTSVARGKGQITKPLNPKASEKKIEFIRKVHSRYIPRRLHPSKMGYKSPPGLYRKR